MDDGFATWHLVQYTADLRSREPRNIGVVLRTPDGSWLSRFFAESSPAVTQGHKLRHFNLKKKPYEAWLAYYRRKMASDEWEDVTRAHKRRPSNFNVELGGQILSPTTGTWQGEVAYLYDALVSETASTPIPGSRSDLKARARIALDEAVLQVETGVIVPATFGSRSASVSFDFRHVNGQPHLMQVVPLRGPGATSRANAFYGQVVAAQAAGAAKSFLAFYDSEHASVEGREIEEVYAALEGVAHGVDLADPRTAVDTVLAATA